MMCDRFAGTAVLEAYEEADGLAWKRHLASCETCAAEVEEIRDVRRAYARIRPLRLNVRTRRAIVSRIRRESNRRRMRSAVASLGAVVAAFLLVAGIGGSPSIVSAAEPAPAGFVIDRGVAEIQGRLAGLETENRSHFDASLDDLKDRVALMSWDAENM